MEKLIALLPRRKHIWRQIVKNFCYLLKFLSEMPGLIELVTEDEKYRINTIMNTEQQKEALEKMADDYVKLDEAKYKKWKEKILQGIQEL